MNTELSNFINVNLFAPLIFIVMCIAVPLFIGAVIYYRFLSRWIPEVVARVLGLGGSLLILFECVKQYEGISQLVAGWSTTGILVGFFVFIIVISIVAAAIPSKKNKKSNKRIQNKNNKSIPKVTSKRPHFSQLREDSDILRTPLDALSGAEFERLLALFFRDQGYEVNEVGVGGKDGGVDLVTIDQRGEKTAVQAKCYADHHMVGVPIVRELVGAKRNHDCILSLLITTSDLTGPAKKEAEQFKVDYWHGGVVEQKLRAWGKWNPSSKKMSQASKKTAQSSDNISRSQVAAASEVICKCGAHMVLRKGREGKAFYGCSTFPKCRNTKSI